MTSVFLFVLGATLLVVSAEKLIAHLVGAASGLRVPLFLLAIVFTGIEFDDITLGVALNLEDLSGVALGIVVGTAMSFTGVVLALATILEPSEVDVPRDYVVLLAGAPLVMVVLTLTAPLTVAHGLSAERLTRQLGVGPPRAVRRLPRLRRRPGGPKERSGLP